MKQGLGDSIDKENRVTLSPKGRKGKPMSTAVLEKSQVSPADSTSRNGASGRGNVPESARIPITRTMARLLADNGLIEERYELIDGEIISKMGAKPPHSFTIRLIFRWLLSLFGVDFVQSQLPIDPDVPDAEIQDPVPDIIALNVSWETMPDRNPTSHEIALAVEVASSSLESDKTKKARLYARAGIVEYWIADTESRTLIVYRKPLNGTYQSVTTYTAEETVSCLAAPDASVLVDALIAPTPSNTLVS